MREIRAPLTACLAIVLCLSGDRGSAQPPVLETIEARGSEFVTPEAQAAIDRGLAWLAARQHRDGSFGSAQYRDNVAVTSLSAMAFLSAGHTPGRGPYGNVVQKATEFVLSRSRPNGFIIEQESASHGPMYGHGFATMFLAEVYGMSPSAGVRQKLDRAVRLIIGTQNKEGGWRYQPRPDDADISVTVAQVMALRAARNAGIFVPKETIDRSMEYVKACQNPDGGFAYQLTRRRESQFPRSAAGVVALYSAGIYEGQEIRNGLEFLMRHLPQGDVYRYESNYYYGHYYAVQAMWHAGGDHWRRWYPAIRDELVRRQLQSGDWPDSYICHEYGTAMALLVLQMPNNYLPIFQR